MEGVDLEGQLSLVAEERLTEKTKPTTLKQLWLINLFVQIIIV